jgi:signal transduction histidine kinase/CheY-like chemotaxis protein
MGPTCLGSVVAACAARSYTEVSRPNRGRARSLRHRSHCLLTAMMTDSPGPGSPADPGFAESAAATRRRLGTRMLAAGVLLAGLQGFFEWLLPYDPMALQALGDLFGGRTLDPRRTALAWLLLTAGVLALLGQAGHRLPARAAPWLGLLAGVLVGSARFTAGGAAPALVLLLLCGVATLGWQSLRHGGAMLLGGAAVAIALIDIVASSFATLWPFCIALSLLFVWIEQRHVQAAERRLIATLAERDTLITQLNSSRAQLTQLQAARTQLLASISHDLRQPLQAVRLYADALRPQLADSGQALLAQQMRAAHDAVEMLDQFSEFGAIEQGMLRSRQETFDLREVIRGVAANLRATQDGAPVRIHEHGRTQWVRSDRSQLSRIVQNLAGNAVRHSLHHARAIGRVEGIRVVIAVREWRGDLAIDIVDDGPGIAPEAQQDIFKPYVQLATATGGAGHRGGRGLGLAIVKALVQQLGLELAPLRSVVGRGTRFRVTVPARLRIEAPAGSAATVAASVAQNSALLKNRLFALLDDEESPRLALAAALRAAGARCVEAADFKTLRAKLDDEVRFPDALLFDLDLGGSLDGLQAVAALRQEWDSEVPAVIVTGRVGARQGLALPPRCSVLGKPVGLDGLAATLQPLLA